MFNGPEEAIMAIRDAEARGDAVECARLCDAALAEHPKSAGLWALATPLLMWRGKQEQAHAALAKAQELAPDSALTLAATASLCSFEGDKEQAQSAAMQALEIDDEDSFVLLRAGDACASAQQFDKAVEIAARAVHLWPDNQHLAVWRIAILTVASRSEEAEQALRELEGRMPGSPLVMKERARSLTRKHKLDESESLLRQAATALPGSASIWGDLSMVLGALKRYDEAEEAARKAISISPVSIVALRAMSTVCRQRGDDAQAQEWLKRAETAVPALRTNAVLSQANAAMRDGEWDKVLSIVESSMADMPRLFRLAALGLKAQALLELNSRRLSAATQPRDDDGRPEDGGLVEPEWLRERDLLTEAEQAIEELTREGRISARLYELRARTLEQQDRLRDATVVLKEGLRLYPDSGLVRARLMRTLKSAEAAAELDALVKDTLANLPQAPWEYVALVMALDDIGYEFESRELREMGLRKFPNAEVLTVFAAIDRLKIGDIEGARKLNSTIRGDMRKAAAALERSASAMDKMRSLFLRLREKRRGHKPPTLN